MALNISVSQGEEANITLKGQEAGDYTGLSVAAGDFETVLDAMAAMNTVGETIHPAGGNVKRYHDAKHKVFHRMYDDFVAYRKIMA